MFTRLNTVRKINKNLEPFELIFRPDGKLPTENINEVHNHFSSYAILYYASKIAHSDGHQEEAVSAIINHPAMCKASAMYIFWSQFPNWSISNSIKYEDERKQRRIMDRIDKKNLQGNFPTLISTYTEEKITKYVWEGKWLSEEDLHYALHHHAFNLAAHSSEPDLSKALKAKTKEIKEVKKTLKKQIFSNRKSILTGHDGLRLTAKITGSEWYPVSDVDPYVDGPLSPTSLQSFSHRTEEDAFTLTQRIPEIFSKL